MPSSTAPAIRSQYKVMARMASSLPGIGKVTPVGSELLTVMELVPNTLPMAGRVIYPALFAAIF